MLFLVLKYFFILIYYFHVFTVYWMHLVGLGVSLRTHTTRLLSINIAL